MFDQLSGKQKDTVKSSKERAAFIAGTLKYEICPFCALTGTKVATVTTDMVQCDFCHKWFHCSCIGIHVDHFSEREFCCCKEPADNFEYVPDIVPYIKSCLHECEYLQGVIMHQRKEEEYCS